MDFDFHKQFKDYSNIDLLKIVRQPANYQPAAVKAAEDILSDRQISAEEISVADQYIQDVENSEKNKKEKINELKHKVADFLEPAIRPGEKVEPDKWVNILLLVIGIQYAWTIFKTVKGLIAYFKCTYCPFDITIAISLFSLIYIPVIFFLLLKRRRWGWILLFADNLFIVISSVCQSYIFFKYQHIHNGDTASYLVQILIRAAFVSFLWRNSITEHFGVPHEIKKKTAFITTAGTLIFIFTTYLLIA
jgi:hypothetical protein